MKALQIPIIENFVDQIRSVVSDLIETEEINLGTILNGIPKFDQDDPAPFVNWLMPRVIFGYGDDVDHPSRPAPFPHLFSFIIKGNTYVVSGNECNLVATSNTKTTIVDA